MTAPTVEDILNQTSTPSGFHRWAVDGGSISVDRRQLQAALETAYDPNMPDWPALISWDEESGFHVA